MPDFERRCLTLGLLIVLSFTLLAQVQAAPYYPPNANAIGSQVEDPTNRLTATVCITDADECPTVEPSSTINPSTTVDLSATATCSPSPSASVPPSATAQPSATSSVFPTRFLTSVSTRVAQETRVRDQSSQLNNCDGSPTVAPSSTLPTTAPSNTVNPSATTAPSNTATVAPTNSTTRTSTATPTVTPTATYTPTRTPTATPTPGCFIPLPPAPGQDTDRDALPDTWEMHGVNGLDLPAMGADPCHKDIFVEVDYTTFRGSQRPSNRAIQRVVAAFANAPVTNPDRRDGITLHVDNGRNSIMRPNGATWGNLSLSNNVGAIQVLGGFNMGGYNWGPFDQLRAVHFDQNRQRVFHYNIFAHELHIPYIANGISRGAPAQDFIVALGSFGGGTEVQQAGTFMHELGHNLGLLHGGNNEDNYKPNYLSIMNYHFQMTGLIRNGANGTLDYSRWNLPALDENALDERVGLNGGMAINGYGTRYKVFNGFGCRTVTVNNANRPINWNGVRGIENVNVQANINCEGGFTVLNSFDDWSNIVYNAGGAIGGAGLGAGEYLTAVPSAEPTHEHEHETGPMTPEEFAALDLNYWVAVQAEADQAVPAGSTTSYTFVLQNQGSEEDILTLTTSSSEGWADLSSLPEMITIAPKSSVTLSINVTVPADADPAAVDSLQVAVDSLNAPLLGDNRIVETSVLSSTPNGSTTNKR